MKNTYLSPFCLGKGKIGTKSGNKTDKKGLGKKMRIT
jgi:hypothetical protein